MNISQKNKDEIIEECLTININVFQTEKIPFKFKLTRKEI